MKTHALTFIILLLGFIAYSQNPNTLQKILYTQNEIEKVGKTSEEALKQLENHIISTKDFDAFSDYAKLLLRYYRKLGKYDIVDSTVQNIKKKYKLSPKVLTNLEIINLWILLYNDQFDKLLSESKVLLEHEADTEQKGWVHYFIGQGKNETGDYEKASNNYLESLKLFSSINHLEGLSYAYSGVGDIQRNLGNLQKSIEYYQQALESAKLAKSTTAETNSSLLLGMSKSFSKDYTNGLIAYKYALELAKADNDFYNMARSLNNIGNVYLRMNNYSEALKANQESLAISLENKMDYGAIANYLNICKIQTAMKNYSEAIKNLDKASAFIENKNSPAEKAEILIRYSEAYEGLGDFKKGLEFYKKHDELRKKLVSEQTQKTVNELQIKYESEVKDRQLEKVKYELDLKQSLNRSLILGIGVLILITIFTVFFLTYRNRRLRELYKRNIENLQAHRIIQRVATTDDDPLRKIFDKVLSLLEKEELYKKPTLSLTELAEYIGSNEKYVSNAISKYSNSNYSNFINMYRINEAKRLIYENPGININDVMIHSGFNSRTPFYNAFTKFTGMSPKQFKGINSNSDIPEFESL